MAKGRSWFGSGSECLGLGACLLAVGCVAPSPKVEPLVARNAAMQSARPNEPRMPKVFAEEQMPESVFEELVPFEWFRTARGNWISVEVALRSDLKLMIFDMPDALSYTQGQSKVGVVLTQHVGFGVSSGQATQSISYRVTAYREAATVMPVSWSRDTGMIMAVRDVAAAGGMQEGDFLVEVGAVPVLAKSYEDWAQSPLQALRLSWRPGESVQVAWIRPGTGRMSGQMRLLPGMASYRGLPDSVHLDMGRIKSHAKETGELGWYFPDR